MADKTKIEWTDATWNIITGCTLVDEGCRNCYAANLIATWPAIGNHPSRKGLAKVNAAGVASFTGEVRFNEQWLDQPLRWRKPRRIFVCAHGDLFHPSVPDAWIDQVFAVMALAPQHTFQVLTKRPERAREYITGLHSVGRLDFLGTPRFKSAAETATRNYDRSGYDNPKRWPLPNVWLGTSIHDQTSADLRIPHLLSAPAAVRFISAEPLLGAVDLNSWIDDLDWVIVGGESGKNARPMHPDWTRSLRDQCAAAGTAFLFKQWGEWAPTLDRDRDDPDWRADYSNTYADCGKNQWLNLAGGRGFHGERFHVMKAAGKINAGRLLDGVEHNGFPNIDQIGGA